MQVGDTIRFIHAPPRWNCEPPRPPENNILGKRVLLMSGPFDDYHDWGGIWKVAVEGQVIHHHADFMEIADEA